MTAFCGCSDYLKWQWSNACTPPSTIPAAALIAPARNLLTAEAFTQRKQACPVDEKVQWIAFENGLAIPATLEKAAPIADHSLSMSLHFAKSYRHTKDIYMAAKLMQKGANLACAKTSAIFGQLFEYNVEQAIKNQVPENDFVDHVQTTLTHTLDLAISKEIALHYPLDEILPYLQNQLAAGEYMIPLIDHVAALIKDEQGKIYLFDPDQGTVDLNTDQGKQWFLELLKKHKVHLTESLTLLKLSDYQPESLMPFEKMEMNFPEESPKLTFEKKQDRWGLAVFQWRGKTYRLPWDSETGYIYNHDSDCLVRTKCFLLIPRTWIDAALRTIYHAAMAALRTLPLPFALVHNRQQAAEQLRKIKQAAFDILRAPFYAVLGTFAAIYGLLKPLDGRRLYSYFERSLNRQQEDAPWQKNHYAAPCFKPWNFEFRHDQAGAIKNLKRISLQLKYFEGNTIVEMLFGWRRACCKC